MLSRIKALFLIIEFVITILITIILMYISRKSNHHIRKSWAKIQSFIMGYSIVQKGSPDPDAKLILMNHQSLVDIIIMEQIHPSNLCWVAKKEIEKIPLFGHIIRAPYMISIDRKDRRSIVKILKQSKERINQGRVIAMFPEGTRGKGQNLLKFQSGAKILAEKLNLKVQPVVLVGTRKIFDSQSMRAKSGQVSVIYLDSVDPASDKNWFENIRENMEKCLGNELANPACHR